MAVRLMRLQPPPPPHLLLPHPLHEVVRATEPRSNSCNGNNACIGGCPSPATQTKTGVQKSPLAGGIICTRSQLVQEHSILKLIFARTIQTNQKSRNGNNSRQKANLKSHLSRVSCWSSRETFHKQQKPSVLNGATFTEKSRLTGSKVSSLNDLKIEWQESSDSLLLASLAQGPEFPQKKSLKEFCLLFASELL